MPENFIELSKILLEHYSKIHSVLSVQQLVKLDQLRNAILLDRRNKLQKMITSVSEQTDLTNVTPLELELVMLGQEDPTIV